MKRRIQYLQYIGVKRDVLHISCAEKRQFVKGRTIVNLTIIFHKVVMGIAGVETTPASSTATSIETASSWVESRI